jgi:hypothetical protein
MNGIKTAHSNRHYRYYPPNRVKKLTSLVHLTTKKKTISYFVCMHRWLLILFFFALLPATVQGQRLVKSFPVKLSSKLSDYEIIGKNSKGIYVHYFGNNEHQVEVFNEGLRSMQRKAIQLRDKNTKLEEIVMIHDGLLAFYSHIEGTQQYLKVRFLNDYLETSYSYLVLDSMPKFTYQGFEPYYIKQSQDLSKIASFSIFDDKGVFSVRFKLYNDSLMLLDQGVFEIERRDMVLKSFKVNNNGVIYAVMSRIGKGTDVHDYAYDEIYTFTFNPESKKIIRQDISSEGGFRFKQIITEISNTTNRGYVVACYKNRNEAYDLGLLVIGSEFAGKPGFLETYPFTKEQMAQMHSYEFKDWVDQAVIILPKRILPRSDGGCIIVNEGQYQYTRVIRTPPTNVYFYGESFTRMYDQNHYFDILNYSIHPNGSMDWRVVLPKVQVTEGDGGLFSSFLMLETNNLLKFLFNEDVYNNGNFIEYNLNANGASKRVSLFNSDKDGITLIPQKGKQISGNQLLIPSEQKRNLQLVLFNY